MEDINSESFKIELDNIRNDYKKAKDILQKIEVFSVRFEEAKKLLNDTNDGIDVNYENIKKKRQEIDILYTQSQSTVSQITENLNKVGTQIESMQSSYNDFSEIKGKVSGKNGEIEQVVENAKNSKNEIEKTKTNAENTLEIIKTLLVDAQQKIQNMQSAYEEFVEIRAKIEDSNTGLQAILNTVQDLQKKSQALSQEIQYFRDESQKLLTTIKNNGLETEKIKIEIQNTFEFTESKKNEIQKATGLIIDTAFAETFERRKKEIEADLNGWKSWKTIFFISTILLGIVVILPFIKWVNIDNSDVWRYLINRIFSATPFVFLILFSASQYSKERDLAEKYAFKASSSAAIRSHIEFIINNFDKQKGDILEFVKETFIKIYKEPYSNNEDSKKLKELEEKIESLKSGKNEKINIEEIIKSTKELKELFPDETLLKKVLDFFTKLITK